MIVKEHEVAKKHIVCFSGGHSSAIVALEVANKYGKENLILLNHNINNKKESADIKRFKMEVSAYIGVPVTYANIKGIMDDELIPNQFDVCIEAGAVTSFSGHALCTAKLKTEPFYDYLKEFFLNKDCIIYYGFDANEMRRVNRRKQILGANGYETDYPLAFWEERKYQSTKEIGIEPPLTYDIWEHANCIGCLKAGLLHWYVVYCTDMDTYKEAMVMEDECDYVIHRITIKKVKTAISLKDLIPFFCQIQSLGVKPTERQNKQMFGRRIQKLGYSEDKLFKPCNCSF